MSSILQDLFQNTQEHLSNIGSDICTYLFKEHILEYDSLSLMYYTCWVIFMK